MGDPTGMPRQAAHGSRTTAPDTIEEVFATLSRRRGTHLPYGIPPRDRALTHYLDGYYIIRDSYIPFNTSGAFCDVFLGSHPVYKKVVMKRPRMIMDGSSSSMRKHIRKEAEIWSLLRHPNILPFIGLIEAENSVWLVSPFATNGTLPDYIGAHPEADREKMVVQLVHAVEYLHRKELVHGDIKGANILISADIDVLLYDFGLAKFQDTMTVASLKGAGSWHWSAPELLLDDESSKTTASDVYAFGMTVYQILSGNIPFNGCSLPALVYAITSNKRPEKEPMTSLSGVSYAALWEIAETCWAVEPSGRPAMSAVQALFRASVYLDRSPLDWEPTSSDESSELGIAQDPSMQAFDALGIRRVLRASSDSHTSHTAPLLPSWPSQVTRASHAEDRGLTPNAPSTSLMLPASNESHPFLTTPLLSPRSSQLTNISHREDGQSAFIPLLTPPPRPTETSHDEERAWTPDSVLPHRTTRTLSHPVDMEDVYPRLRAFSFPPPEDGFSASGGPSASLSSLAGENALRMDAISVHNPVTTEEPSASGSAFNDHATTSVKRDSDLEASLGSVADVSGRPTKRVRIEDPPIHSEDQSDGADEDANRSFANALEQFDFTLLDGEQPYRGGGHSDVFRAHHKTHLLVAVKRPRFNDDVYLQSLKVEAKIWQTLSHRHILPLIATIENGPQLHLVSPLLMKGTALQYVNDNPGTNRRKLIGQMASAIGYLHEKGIVHGDIKGGNTLISNEGELVVCDFGLSKSLEDGMTTDSGLKGAGTLYWQAPELHGPQQDTSADEELDFIVKKTFKTDVYAFGITIPEILTGKQPFHRIFSTTAFVMDVIRKRKRPKMEPTTSPSGESYSLLWELASWCWDGDPNRRPSMADVCTRLGVSIKLPPIS